MQPNYKPDAVRFTEAIADRYFNNVTALTFIMYRLNLGLRQTVTKCTSKSVATGPHVIASICLMIYRLKIVMKSMRLGLEVSRPMLYLLPTVGPVLRSGADCRLQPFSKSVRRTARTYARSIRSSVSHIVE